MVRQFGVRPAPACLWRGTTGYILYIRTTGDPRCVPTAGHLVALNWTMKNVYNVEPGEVFGPLDVGGSWGTAISATRR